MNPRSKFAGGDQEYLRTVQYSTSERLKRRAGLHDRFSTAPVRWFDWVLKHAALIDSERVLELGCGAGWLWDHHTTGSITLTLTDLSPGMVAEAVSRASSAVPFSDVSGEPADAQSLPFADDCFDVVIANHMLYHLPDPTRGVSEIARVLDPGGRALIATNGRRHMREIWNIRHQVFGADRVDQTVDVFGIETGFPVLRDQFAHVDWHAYPDQLRCDDPEAVVDYLCSTPPGEDATPAQHAQLRELVAIAFSTGAGTMTITKDTGCFICTAHSRP